MPRVLPLASCVLLLCAFCSCFGACVCVLSCAGRRRRRLQQQLGRRRRREGGGRCRCVVAFRHSNEGQVAGARVGYLFRPLLDFGGRSTFFSSGSSRCHLARCLGHASVNAAEPAVARVANRARLAAVGARGSGVASRCFCHRSSTCTAFSLRPSGVSLSLGSINLT